MKNKIKEKGGSNVKKFNLASNLVNQPWLIDLSWMEAMVDILLVKKADFDSAFTEVEGSVRDSFYDNGSRSYLADESTLVIPIAGPIFPTKNFYTMFYTGVACDAVVNTIHKAKADPNISKVQFLFDSPGGYITGVNNTAKEIKSLGEIKETESIVYGTCASAAYWFASNTNKIYAEETARLGSIGVVVTYPKNDDGYYVEIVNDDSPNKRPDPETKEGISTIKKELNSLAKIFITSVAKGRGISNKQVINDFGQGGMLVGKEAVEAGMADGILEFDNGNIVNKEKQKKVEDLMDVKTLKKEYPDTYQEIVEEATKASLESVKGIEEENKKLKEQLGAQDATIQTQEDRLKSLEKEDSLRKEKELASSAHRIFHSAIAKSSIPERLHSKVEKQVDYNSFVEEGALDKEGYEKAVNDELKDWTGAFEATNEEDDFIQGHTSDAVPNHSDEFENKVNGAANDMLKTLGIEIE